MLNTVKLRDLMRENDYREMVVSLDNGINRTKIETALVDAGYTLPLPNKVGFDYVNGQGWLYAVTWFPIPAVYGYEKLTVV